MKNKILPGQLTYNKELKSWTYTPLPKLTQAICQERYKIQGHTNEINGNDYYIGHAISNHTHPSANLEKMILWVEESVKGE